MPVSVVDLFKVIQIEIHHANLRVAAVSMASEISSWIALRFGKPVMVSVLASTRSRS
jgi:putative lipase involved disintegration of autophagic bodies